MSVFTENNASVAKDLMFEAGCLLKIAKGLYSGTSDFTPSPAPS